MSPQERESRAAHPSMYGRDIDPAAETTAWSAGEVGDAYRGDARGYDAPAEPSAPLLGDLYDLKGLATEFAIITVVAAIVMGLVAAVADLVLVLVSGWLGGDYAAMSSVTAYTVVAALFAVSIVAATGVYLLLDAKVTEPDQVWGWMSVGIPGLLIAVLLLTALTSGASLYPAAFIGFLVVIGGGFIGSFIPTRVMARRTPAWSQVRGF